jgi:hypothetical protein
LLEQAREEARIANKRRYQRLIGLALGGAGLAAALAGMPMEVTLGLWAVGAASWAILKRV